MRDTAPASTPASAGAAPIAAEPVVTPPVATTDATPAPVEAVRPTPIEAAPPVASADNSNLALIGAGVLAALALGAAGFALTRRRRRTDEWDADDIQPVMAAEPAPLAEQPAPRAAPVTATTPAPSIAAGPATLANGFDISHYGRHVQAAYRGPTPNNPFVSLKKRLTRAHFYDMQEARAEAGESAPAPRASAPAPQPAKDRFEVRSPAKSSPRSSGFRPAFQR